MTDPVNIPLDIYQGDSFDFFFRMYDQVYDAISQKYVKGNPLDLTGYTFNSQIRQTQASSTTLAEFTITPSDQGVPDSRGFVLLSLAPAVTTTLLGGVTVSGGVKVKVGVWDFEVTEPSGKVTTIFVGDVNVTPEVTR